MGAASEVLGEILMVLTGRWEGLVGMVRDGQNQDCRGYRITEVGGFSGLRMPHLSWAAGWTWAVRQLDGKDIGMVGTRGNCHRVFRQGRSIVARPSKGVAPPALLKTPSAGGSIRQRFDPPEADLRLLPPRADVPHHERTGSAACK